MRRSKRRCSEQHLDLQSWVACSSAQITDAQCRLISRYGTCRRHHLELALFFEPTGAQALTWFYQVCLSPGCSAASNSTASMIPTWVCPA